MLEITRVEKSRSKVFLSEDGPVELSDNIEL